MYLNKFINDLDSTEYTEIIQSGGDESMSIMLLLIILIIGGVIGFLFMNGTIKLSATPTNPPQTNPPQTNPPQTNPPQTNPPQTNPPQTNPPQTNPPQTTPPTVPSTNGPFVPIDELTRQCITAFDTTGFIPVETWGTTPGNLRIPLCQSKICPYMQYRYGNDYSRAPDYLSRAVNFCKDPAQVSAWERQYGNTQNPPGTNAPQTNAPQTNAPQTNPSQTNPPQTNSPGTNPPTNVPTISVDNQIIFYENANYSGNSTIVTNLQIGNTIRFTKIPGSYILGKNMRFTLRTDHTYNGSIVNWDSRIEGGNIANNPNFNSYRIIDSCSIIIYNR